QSPEQEHSGRARGGSERQHGRSPDERPQRHRRDGFAQRQPRAHAAAEWLHSEVGIGHGKCPRAPRWVAANPVRYFARSTQMISLSLRTYIFLCAKAGWHQTTLRPKTALVGSITLARSISS